MCCAFVTKKRNKKQRISTKHLGIIYEKNKKDYNWIDKNYKKVIMKLTRRRKKWCFKQCGTRSTL